MAELIVTISLVLLGLGMVIANLHHRKGGGQGSMGLARQVARDLRAVRQRACVSGNPRAFCIPTAVATTPCSQSYYIMSGHGFTAPRQVIDTTRDYPESYLFVGSWPAMGASIGGQIHSSPTYPPVIPALPPFLVSQWMNPVVRDFVFAFNSDGRLATNDLPHDSRGNCYIVISDGLKFTPGSAPPGTAIMGASPPPYFDLTAANQPFVITVGASGSVSVSQGFPSSSVAVTSDQPGPPPLAPAPPAVKPTLTQPPVVDSLPVEPVGNPANYPFDTTVPPDGRVSVTLNAYDPDGEDLTYSFVSTSLDGPAPGKFTYTSTYRGLRYPVGGAMGQAKVDWVPPASVQLGDRFKLDATVTDESGHSTTSTGSVTVNLQVNESGVIAYESQGDIWTMLGDGTRNSNRTNQQGGNSWPDLSPDGRRIAFVSTRPLAYHDVAANTDVTLSFKRIWVMNYDGSNPQAITNVDGSTPATITATKTSRDDCPSWSPDGSKVVFARTIGTTSKIQVVRADGSWFKQDLDVGTAPSWSRVAQANGKDILYEHPNAGGSDIYQMTSMGTGMASLVTGGSKPVWAPDGTRFVYVTSGGLQEANATGGSPSVKSSSLTGRPAFNPQGDRFIIVSGTTPYRYQDPGLGVGATTGTSFLSPIMTPFSGIVSWGIRY